MPLLPKKWLEQVLRSSSCLSAPRLFYSHSVVAECETPLRAMEFCLKFGFSQIEFKGDA